MKRRIIQLVATYFLFLFIFILQKPLFMVYYHTLYNDVSWMDWLKVIWHGLPLDCSLAGYLTLFPGLLLLASAWTKSKLLKRIRSIYFLIISILLAAIFIGDLGLYGYWGFRLDTTPLFYFFSSPKDAIASVSTWTILGGLLATCIYAFFIYISLNLTLNNNKQQLKIPYHQIRISGIILLLTGLLFIPIRGGFTVSTMNLGKVYFSADLKLNHAAINPCFSLMDSFSRQTAFDKQYRFLSPEKADALFTELTDKPVTDSIPQLFNTKRPNVLLIVLESFSSYLMESLGGEPGIAVHLDSLANQGILFTHFYANSFRTDRGLVSILSGYPAQPTTSIMKYTRKTQNLPSLPASLKKAGYQLHYYYGGDADFTNMRSYLVSTGIEHIVSDKDFPTSQRTGKWGAHDHVVFERLMDDLKKEKLKEPFFTVLQTSSSHEPFEVPFEKLADARLNAFAYTDSCTGDFIQRLKATSEWQNTAIILVPDHLGAYPDKHLSGESPSRYRIPLIITGGAVKEPKQIDTYGSQIDVAATLLAQFDLPHTDFTFSKNMLNPASPQFAFFTFPNLFGMVTSDNEVVFNCESNTEVVDEGTQKGKNLDKGKAYLQKLYDDLEKR